MSRKAAWTCLLALSAFYCVAELVPGRFAVSDEVYFKAAGRNWAATGRFAAPEETGFTSIVPPVSEVFSCYPPLYPFLFGVYTKVVGFAPKSCILYDLAIHLLLVGCGVLAARLVYRLPWSTSILCGALLIPLGTVGRPDELGIVFALGAALALRREVPLRFAIPLGGALLGLCCATSPGACLFLGPLVGWEATLREQSHLRKLRNFVATALVGIVVASACVAPILVTHPLAYRQMATLGKGKTVFGNAGVGDHISRIGLVPAWIYSFWYGYDKGILIAGGLIFCLLCWRLDKNREGTAYSRFVLIAFSVLLLLFLMPGEYTYLWFSGSWLLIACVALGWRISQSLPRSRWRPLLALAVLGWLIASMPYFRRKLILWTLPTDQSFTVNIKRVQDEVPVGAGVLTSEYWWALAGRNPVYDPLFSHPGPDAFEYVVMTGNGSGRVGEPRLPEVGLGESQWQISDDDLRSKPPSIFGLRLSRSAYGFGPYILKKGK